MLTQTEQASPAELHSIQTQCSQVVLAEGQDSEIKEEGEAERFERKKSTCRVKAKSHVERNIQAALFIF